jgi:hypothetical protein
MDYDIDWGTLLATEDIPPGQLPEINRLAWLFYSLEGYGAAGEDFDFSQATHPHEVRVYQQAVLAFNFWSERLS